MAINTQTLFLGSATIRILLCLHMFRVSRANSSYLSQVHFSFPQEKKVVGSYAKVLSEF